MEKRKITIPEESYEIVEFIQDNLPGIAIVNEALKAFEHKDSYLWNCSIMVDLEEVDEEGMPSDRELEVLEQLESFFDLNIKGVNEKEPNALFFGKIIWNSSCELIWKVSDVEAVNNFLDTLVDSEKYPREFGYWLEEDNNWGDEEDSWDIMTWLFEE